MSTDDERRLTLYGKIVVAKLVSSAEKVAACIGDRPSNKTPVYVLRREGTESYLCPVPLSQIAASLRFEGTPNFLLIKNGTVSPQQLQSIRRLHRDSARLLDFAWRTRDRDDEHYEQNDEFHDPEESDIDEDMVPNPSRSTLKQLDREARQQALDNRVSAHWKLVREIKQRATASELTAKKTVYIDVVAYRDHPSRGAVIIEVKSLENDDADQTRRAIGQLVLYQFLHYRRYGDAGLVAAFTRRPTYKGLDLTRCLGQYGIGAIWRTKTGFNGTAAARGLVPWLLERAT